MFWSRKPLPAATSPRGGHVGLDLTAARALAAAVQGGRVRPVSPEALPLAVDLERRPPVVGVAAAGAVRVRPHQVCTNFLPAVGTPREWKAGRLTLTADDALRFAFEAIRPAVVAESDALGIGVPSYLTAKQVERVVDAAHDADLPLEGTVAAALAVTADRAAAVLTHAHADAEPDEPVVMPLRPGKPGPGAVLILDVDDHALFGSAVAVEPDRVHLLASMAWPRAGLKPWREKLIDAVAARCVRVCRRDPRDSADAEQALFDQLDGALDRLRLGRAVTLTVRTDSWYQDVTVQPTDFDAACAGLAAMAADGVRELTASAGLPGPPRALWLTAAAGRLPGLFAAVHGHTAECTAVDVLPPTAVAVAVARLVPRWLAGELPRTHVEHTLAHGVSADPIKFARVGGDRS